MSEGTSLTPIAIFYHCYYDIYANLTAAMTGYEVSELAFATDRMVLYRYNGVDLDALNWHISSGAIADIPAAADLPNGSLYFATDTVVLYQTIAGAWVAINSPAFYTALTASTFRDNAATGTVTSPGNVNDNNTGMAGCRGTVIGQYAEVLFDNILRKITQYRQYGWTSNTGDGVWKLQYLDSEYNWIDWITAIPARNTNDWSNWASGSEVVALGIRLVVTTVDTNAGGSYCTELEVKY